MVKDGKRIPGKSTLVKVLKQPGTRSRGFRHSRLCSVRLRSSKKPGSGNQAFCLQKNESLFPAGVGLYWRAALFAVRVEAVGRQS